MYKNPVLSHDLIKHIFTFCNEQTLLEAHLASEELYFDALYVLHQRLIQELSLFGIKPEHLCLEKLSFKQIYQLRRCLWAIEHHDTFAAQALIPKAKSIKKALIAIMEDQQKPIINYLYNIFSALAKGNVPIIEQLPTYLAALDNIKTPIQQRLMAIYDYSKNNAACLPLFKQLAQSNDPVASWYLFQIYRLGLCDQAQNITLAKQYLVQASPQCVKSPEYVNAYRETFMKKAQRSLRPAPFPSLIDDTILGVAQQLSSSDKDTLIHNLTHHQKNSKPLKIKI